MKHPILTFIHISDTHIPSDSQAVTEANHPLRGARALLEKIKALPFEPDFILHTGDVIYDGDPADYATVQDLFAVLPYPIYYVAGNGDDVVALQRTLLGRETPRNPFFYEFEVKGVQCLVLDSNTGDGSFAGVVSDDQLAWLGERCAAEDSRPLVIAMHHNPQLGGVPWLDQVTGIQNTDALHAAIFPARGRLRGVFFGHVHQNIDMYRDGILYCSTLSSWMQFHAWPGQTDPIPDADDGPGFSVVMIYENQTVIRRHRIDVGLS